MKQASNKTVYLARNDREIEKQRDKRQRREIEAWGERNLERDRQNQLKEREKEVGGMNSSFR